MRAADPPRNTINSIVRHGHQATPRRHELLMRLRFTIRDLFWTMLAAALVSLWYRDRGAITSQTEAVNETVAQRRDEVQRILNDESVRIEAYRRALQNRPPAAPPPNDMRE